jgi:hypothetical protein
MFIGLKFAFYMFSTGFLLGASVHATATGNYLGIVTWLGTLVSAVLAMRYFYLMFKGDDD